eukprot:CAMPEP_0119309390 /NCGR_PEP_ID=MMETSP1333-20130426/15261_1 /TAXON_ID=418940 /ORGANISM="Scyphosphaera apsteinii, Strain RCC1455" /LENGTH=255 /DNA_ID=CAMNT_0007313351 /DNA_START=48 /DNA_END=815 /DNA_ORIENTATION=+
MVGVLGIQLGVHTPLPAARRAPLLRMQIPGTNEPTTVAEASTIEGMGMATGPTFRRAEFWSNETATLVDVVNVIGRFELYSDFNVRTDFTELTKQEEREEDERQGYTYKRYQMAQRMGCVERVALIQNAPNLPFTNARLAASIGLTCEDFNAMPVTKAMCNVVYDALTESRSTLIPYTVLDQRRAKLVSEDGAFDELAFRLGLYKSRFVVVVAWFLFGKGNFVWILVAAQFLHDLRPDVVPTPKDMGLFKIGTFI